jgi:hypothetical protein
MALLKPLAEANTKAGKATSATGATKVGRRSDVAAKGTGKSGKTLDRADKLADAAEDESLPEDTRALAQELSAAVDADEKSPTAALAELDAATKSAGAAEQETVHRGQKKALSAATNALEKHAAALAAAFPEDADNYDKDSDPDLIRDQWKRITAATAAINRVAKDRPKFTVWGTKLGTRSPHIRPVAKAAKQNETTKETT